MNFNPTQWAVISAFSAMAALGCTPMSPHLDSTFGTSLKTLRTMQTVNPGASANPANPQLDGTAASEAIGRYGKSFSTPSPQSTGFGGSTGMSTSGH